jgi:predicted nucleic acid-binding protein
VRIFFDASAFAKRYIAETGSGDVDALCARASGLAVGVICIPEILSALNRRVREGALTPRQYAEAKRRLSEDIRDADVVDLTPAVIAIATKVLESSPVRALDALHIACAVAWKPGLFVTSDKRQIEAARREGLKTELV